MAQFKMTLEPRQRAVGTIKQLQGISRMRRSTAVACQRCRSAPLLLLLPPGSPARALPKQVHSPSSSRPRDAAKRAFACAAQPDGNKSADVVNTDESGDLPGMPPPVDGMPPLGSLRRAHSGSAGTGTTSGGVHDDAGSSSSSSSSRGSGNASEVESRSSADSPGVRAALAALRWYRGVLSPLMTSTCRFVPTCSQYSMDAYSRYGVAKGTVLTAWRLLRCNPLPLIGGSGYEPASWPPPHAPGWLFAAPGSPEVAVIVGAAAFLRLAHALLFE